ncbi:MAG: hypothetical protein RTU63_04595 [Candidatus Thorarchaeota archaeon]
MPGVRDRIIVSKDKLAHCMWCGSPQSNEWVLTATGEIFCTNECALAANAGKLWDQSIAVVKCSMVLLITCAVAVVFGFVWIGLLIPLLILLLCSSFIGFTQSYAGKEYQDRKGKYAGFPPLECEYCSHPNPPSVPRCLNCDATLANASFRPTSVPPWIIEERKRNLGVICPLCNAVYSYLPAMISDEGQVNCQNCNRQFSVPIASEDSTSASGATSSRK